MCVNAVASQRRSISVMLKSGKCFKVDIDSEVRLFATMDGLQAHSSNDISCVRIDLLHSSPLTPMIDLFHRNFARIDRVKDLAIGCTISALLNLEPGFRQASDRCQNDAAVRLSLYSPFTFVY